MIEQGSRYQVFVVILNWNRPEDTIACVQSLVAQKGVHLHILVVDNGSTDDSTTRLKSVFPWLHLMELDKNLGYPGGMNAGIRVALESQADHILLLNNDTVADPCMIERLVNELGPGIGIASPVIFYHDQVTRPWSVGGNITALFLEQITPHHVGHLVVPEKPVFKTYFTGCALLVKREVFQRVGLFDERFNPGYYEDLDFCWRVLRAKIRMLLVPEAKLWHKVSSSSGGETNPSVRYLKARNGAYYIRKHMKWWQFPFIISYRFGRAVWSGLKLAMQKDHAGLAALWNGLLVGWLDLGKETESKYLARYEVDET